MSGKRAVAIKEDKDVQFIGSVEDSMWRGLKSEAILAKWSEDLPPVPGLKIRPAEALNLAEPYLGDSERLRRAHVETGTHFCRPDTGGMREYIVRKGDFYYVSRETISVFGNDGYHHPGTNADHTVAEFFIPFAVRVNGITGEVVKPGETE